MNAKEFRQKQGVSMPEWNSIIDKMMEDYAQHSNKWVSVEDRLPNEQGNDYSVWCLACDSVGYIFKSRYDFVYKKWVDYQNITDDKVTHWMPLPKPPQK